MVWYKTTDLRVHDHEPLFRAHQSASTSVLPVLIVDPRCYGAGRTPLFGFVKASPMRARFLSESIAALRDELRSRGSDLLVLCGDPVDELPRVCAAVGATRVLAFDEWAFDELQTHSGM